MKEEIKEALKNGLQKILTRDDLDTKTKAEEIKLLFFQQDLALPAMIIQFSQFQKNIPANECGTSKTDLEAYFWYLVGEANIF